MINWTKETARKNYCGWCDGHPPSSPCNGTCFNPSINSNAMNNRQDHIQEELAHIPGLRKELDEREAVLKQEFERTSIEHIITTWANKEADSLFSVMKLDRPPYNQWRVCGPSFGKEGRDFSSSQEAETFMTTAKDVYAAALYDVRMKWSASTIDVDRLIGHLSPWIRYRGDDSKDTFILTEQLKYGIQTYNEKQLLNNDAETKKLRHSPL